MSKDKSRYVVDTNVLVSAVLFKQSMPARVLNEVSRYHQLLASDATLAELTKVFTREKFDRYLSQEDCLLFLSSLSRDAEIIGIRETITVCRDPKDDKFLELALSGKATALITGDKDLLDLHPFRSLPILAPKDFLLNIGNLPATLSQ
jgi:uncharacterized protein